MFDFVGGAAFASAFFFAETASSSASPGSVREVGLLVAGLVLAFSIWQFREQLDRVKRPEQRFNERSEREFKFLKRQAFRRLQLSGLSGLAGATMLVGLYVPADRAPRIWALCWLAVLFFVGWTALLAGADAFSIWLHYSSAGRKRSAERILLEYQMRQKAERRAAAEKERKNAKNERRNSVDSGNSAKNSGREKGDPTTK